jgi:uncharacterized membrane protein
MAKSKLPNRRIQTKVLIMKKSMLLATVVAALVFSSLPSLASAGEFIADCETGPTCSYTVAGGAAAFGGTSGETTSCTGVSGNGTVTSGSSTGTVTLIFTGCRETVTFFRFSCSNTSTAGKVETTALVTHNIYIDPSSSTPGVLLTGVNVTYNCAGFAKRTVTGNIIGHIENPNCGTFQASHKVTFEAPSHGQQKYKQITTTGTMFDLIRNDDTEGEYETLSATGTGTATYNQNRVRLTC